MLTPPLQALQGLRAEAIAAPRLIVGNTLA